MPLLVNVHTTNKDTFGPANLSHQNQLSWTLPTIIKPQPKLDGGGCQPLLFTREEVGTCVAAEGTGLSLACLSWVVPNDYTRSPLGWTCPSDWPEVPVPVGRSVGEGPTAWSLIREGYEAMRVCTDFPGLGEAGGCCRCGGRQAPHGRADMSYFQSAALGSSMWCAHQN